MPKVVVKGDKCHGICDFGLECCPHTVEGICLGGPGFEAGPAGKQTQRCSDPIDMTATCPHLGICPTGGIANSDTGTANVTYAGKGSVKLNVDTWHGPQCNGIHDEASSNVFDEGGSAGCGV